MSVVTDVLLLSGCGESQSDDDPIPPPIAAINTWLVAEGYGELKELAEHAGGHKHMQCEVFGGAFNYLRLIDFLETVRAQLWEDRDAVRILIQEENDLNFSFYDIDRKLA